MISFFLGLFCLAICGAVIFGMVAGIKEGTAQRKYSRSRKMRAGDIDSSNKPSRPSSEREDENDKTILERRTIYRGDRAIGSVTFSVIEQHQKKDGPLEPVSLDAIGGYVSPSGGYINYARFQVVGIKPSTKRRNTRIYEAFREEDALNQARAEGLVEPFEVKVLPVEPPSDRQLSYARSLGATIPEGACKQDVSAIIDRIVDEEEEPVEEQFAKAANDCGVKFSRYHGRTQIMNLAISLSPEEYSRFLRLSSERKKVDTCMDEYKNVNESSLPEEKQPPEETSASEPSEQLPENASDLQQSSVTQQEDDHARTKKILLGAVSAAIALGLIISLAQSSLKQAEEDALAASTAAEISAELEKAKEKFESSEPPYTEESMDALAHALDLLDAEPLSRRALIDRLIEEEYSVDDAYWAADHCGDVWNNNAFLVALSHMRGSDLSSEEIAEILISEKEFTKAEAIYGVAKAEVELEQGR